MSTFHLPHAHDVDDISDIHSSRFEDIDTSFLRGETNVQWLVRNCNALSMQPSVATGKHKALQNASKLLARGLCPHQVVNFGQRLSPTTFEYLTSFDLPTTRTADHRRCINQSQCIAYNVNSAIYRTRHVSDNCNCEMIPIPYAELCQTIRDGDVPLVSIHCNQQRLRFRLTKREASTRYTAISHVWYDGLGNPLSNNLPECRVRELDKYLSGALQQSEVSDGHIC